MKITYSWLEEFVADLKDFSPQDIANKLTMSGTEVKRLEYTGDKYKNIIIAQIESFIKHPNADKLSLCKVNIGSEILNIVCGANNFKEKDLVALALEGAKIGDFTIKKSKIRGEYSEGMMCSEKELGLSQESEGILILEGNYKLGESFARQVGLDDWVFEIEVTPNRPDCLSVIGIAREISAITGLRFKSLEYDCQNEININKNFQIEIKNLQLCPRYSAKIFKDIVDKKTPDWMKNRLLLCDIRSINLVVDLTNYIMLETGQPLHAFDAELLASNKIIVRTAQKNESITLIDGTVRTLNEDTIVIADEKNAVAIAGIMGGKDTEINEKTKNVFLESANFWGPSIMKTSKKLGLRSEASNRFEKKIDPMLTIIALKRFEELLNKITGQKFEKVIYDCYLDVNRERNINLRFSKIKQILGIDIERKAASLILERLGIKNKISDDYISALVPSFRFEDLEREIDLVEEIARIYGFENIPTQKLDSRSSHGKYSYSQKMTMKIRQTLEDSGFNEVINYSFISLKEFNFFKLNEETSFKDYVRISNPLNEDFEILRTTLLQSLVKNLKDNISRKILNLRIFEISKVFFKDNSGKNNLPIEKTRLAVLLSGKANLKSWNYSERTYDFYDLKGLLEYLFEKFLLKDSLKLLNNEYKFFHPSISADINFNNEKIGIIGKIHPQLVNLLDIRQDVYFMEIDLDNFIIKSDKKQQFKQIPQFPSISIDLAIVIDEKVTNSEVEEEIYKNGGKNLVNLRLFDLYKGKQIEDGKKSLAYSLEFRADDRTLKDLEVEIISKRIIENLNRKFGAVLRQ
ncbi:MAG: phenylalanine--tRNA ligase subunit beta [Actinobacteria bacterium]|nr:phenylalanine--tRNA ligase subunit beta [Cyanobacteriota bacterium]MCL5772244.1 phenylalanine--tRNA ligase subunit beta [Actinomycetota bacterium]